MEKCFLLPASMEQAGFIDHKDAETQRSFIFSAPLRQTGEELGALLFIDHKFLWRCLRKLFGVLAPKIGRIP